MSNSQTSALLEAMQETKSAKASAKITADSPFSYPLDPTSHVVCGIDEAGRGPLMGDVVAACVILDPSHPIEGLNDSKALSEAKRDALAPLIKQYAKAYGIGRASPAEIDQFNILNATYLAMRRAYDAMQVQCELALVDGNRIPKNFDIWCEPVVKGDARVMEIAASSILAKTTRDADLYALDREYPEYGFARHKGYPTKEHMEIIATKEIISCYRKSFKPVRDILIARGLMEAQEPSPKESKCRSKRGRTSVHDFNATLFDDL